MNAPATGYYSLIQYCPDRSRLEAANVGVMLFAPSLGFLRARLAQGNDRIRRFFQEDSGDLSQVNAMKRQLEHAVSVEAAGINTLEALQDFSARFANELLISRPRPLRVENPEVDLAQLFDELVGGRVRRDPRIEPRVLDVLRDRLEAPEFAATVQKNTKVQVPVLDEEITADYSFQNGRLNLVQAKQFDQRRAADALREAYETAVGGHLLFKHADSTGNGRQLVVVGAFGEAVMDLRERIEGLLREHDVVFYPEESVDLLIQRIRETAHLPDSEQPPRTAS